nr:helix-turn-helix transcriptional regulator [Levilactobacillus spicheri]
MELSTQLKRARMAQHLSQNEVATILHVSRQSISKWENGRGYPDSDNLIRLSDLYHLSLDDLVQHNFDQPTPPHTANHLTVRQREVPPVNTSFHQNTDEGLLLLLLTLASALLPPVGIFLPLYVIWRNNKYNSLHKTIIVISILVSLYSLMGTYSIISDDWIKPSQTTVYRVD